MLLNYFRLALRTLIKNKISFTINLIGMGIALGCCVAAWVNFEFNNEFDQKQSNVSEIYRIAFINESEGKQTPYGVTPLPMAGLLKENFNEVEHVIRYMSRDGIFRIGDEMFKKEFVYVDPAFTDVFTMELISGSLKLSDKTHVLISDRLAKTYYGSSDALGKGLTQIVSGQPREYVVGGVYKAFPGNSSFRFDLLTTFDNFFADPEQQSLALNDWKRWTTTFLKIKDKGSITRMEDWMKQYVKPQNEARPDLQAKTFYIEPFVGMAQRAVREKNQGHWLNQPMVPAAVIAPFIMAAFLLLVACFNFTNNSIAAAGKRLKEIGIRKVIGGRRKELILQFLAETFLFCLMALSLALVLAEFLVQGWEMMWPGLELEVRYLDNAPFLIALGSLITITALLAGSYPAFYISSFRPIQILRGTTRFGGTNFFTKSLLVVQFSISLAAVIFATAFYFNAKFQKSYDLGYSYNSVIQVPLDNADQFAQLSNALATNRQIHSVGGTEHHIYTSSYKASARTDKQKEKEVDVLNVGDEYFNTLNVRIIAGREFEKDKASDLTESIIVNEDFVRYFNLGNEAVGKRIMLNDTVQSYIVGVVKDVYLRALFQPIGPLVFKYTPQEKYRYLVASTDPDKLRDVNDEIKATWQKLFPNTLYTGNLMEERMTMAMDHFDNVVILYTFLGMVAIIMSVSGLYALVSINLQKRTKELGIRKILGAPLSNIMLQASRMFLIIMLFSFVIGAAGGSFLVNKMMDTVWEYYEAVDVVVLVLSISILFLISVMTVALKIVNVSVTNPVESLRYE
jgi:putative ABC transport system permease protein